MDLLITAAAHALVQGDPLGATLVLRPLNTRPDGSGSRVLSFQIFDILVAIFLSRTIATPPAVAPSTETPPVISRATLLKHTGHIGQFSFHRLGTSSL
jgi:hypothetical protein